MTTQSSGFVLKRLSALIVFLGFCAVAYFLIITGPKTEPTSKLREPKSVSVINIQPSIHSISVQAHGTVIPVRQVALESQVTGPIVSHHPHLVPGGMLKEGTELFAVDPTLTRLSLRESNASVARAEAMLKESHRIQAETKLLAQQKVIADTELAAIDAQVDVQKAELERLVASRDRIEEMLERHVVKAPFNALVLDESVEIGQRINPGVTVATLIGTDACWVRASIPVPQLQWIRLPSEGKPGSSVDVFFDTGTAQEEQRQGHVVQLLGNMEEQGRMARVLIEIQHPFDEGDSERLPFLMGSYVRVEIDAGELHDVLAIDRATLREGDQIWVADAENKLQIRQANVRWKMDETIYIDNALKLGETLVVSPLRVALPGMMIRPNAINKGPSTEKASKGGDS